MLRKILKFFLQTLCHPINFFLKKKKFLIIFRRGKAIGDHVYMTSVIKKINEKNFYKIILFSNYGEFFLNNPRVYKLFNVKYDSLIWPLLNILKSENILEFRSTVKDNDNKHFLSHYLPNYLHLAQGMSDHFNLNIDYSNLQNEIFFSDDEIVRLKNEINLPSNFALIQSVAKSTYTKNKEWKFEGMQEVVNKFDKINWVQIGKNDEPKLKNCKYLLDLNFRELSYVIKKCKFLVVYEGLYNHIASCFNKKTFIIHLGFLHINSFKYPNSIVINQNSMLDCYPCYSLDCKNHNRLMSEKFVIEELKKYIN